MLTSYKEINKSISGVWSTVRCGDCGLDKDIDKDERHLFGNHEYVCSCYRLDNTVSACVDTGVGTLW
jgi:hypothetical protein